MLTSIPGLFAEKFALKLVEKVRWNSFGFAAQHYSLRPPLGLSRAVLNTSLLPLLRPRRLPTEGRFAATLLPWQSITVVTCQHRIVVTTPLASERLSQLRVWGFWDIVVCVAFGDVSKGNTCDGWPTWGFERLGETSRERYATS